jgi:hypothetical protein
MHLYLNYQSLNTFGSIDIAQVKVFQNYVKDQGQNSWYQKKGLFIMHLYLKYQSPNTFGSILRYIAQVKVFQNQVKDQGQKSWYQKTGLFILIHLYLKYQSHNTFGSIDIAQVKFFQN